MFTLSWTFKFYCKLLLQMAEEVSAAAITADPPRSNANEGIRGVTLVEFEFPSGFRDQHVPSSVLSPPQSEGESRASTATTSYSRGDHETTIQDRLTSVVREIAALEVGRKLFGFVFVSRGVAPLSLSFYTVDGHRWPSHPTTSSSCFRLSRGISG